MIELSINFAPFHWQFGFKVDRIETHPEINNPRAVSYYVCLGPIWFGVTRFMYS